MVDEYLFVCIESVVDVICSALLYNPVTRISAQDLIQNQFFDDLQFYE